MEGTREWVGAYLSLSLRGREVGGDGRLFEVDANSRLGAYSNKYCMPVLEEAKITVYVTNHNMIAMAMVIFKTYKMADKLEERVLTKILVYSFFIEPFICLFVTMNWELP